jgi:hypothetical protein
VSLFVLDTDHLTLYQMGHPQLVQNVALPMTDQLAICVITVEEQLTGWQRALHQAKDDARREQIYQRMALAVETLSGWLVLPLTRGALTVQRYGERLRDRFLSSPPNALRRALFLLDRFWRDSRATRLRR